MKDTTKIRDWLLDNCVDEDGDLMLDYLDFSNFDGSIYINSMKVKGDLYQDAQKVQGDLILSHQEVQGDIHHGNSKYGGMLIEHPYSRILQKVTVEELAEMGYELEKDSN